MPRTADPTTQYARAVIAGKITVGRLVKLACQRHLDDLRTAKKRGLVFDVDAAARAIRFFDWLSLTDGEGTRPFKLQPFQAFIVGSIFGWKGTDGYRRFRTAYIEQAKGNGKTPTLAGIGLYGLVADGEGASEIYSAATTREQANILYNDARIMAESSAALRSRLDLTVAHTITHPASRSLFRAVSSEHRALDGKRPHMALIDEIHEHPNSLVVDKMRAGTKSRRQALICEITNAGYDRASVCWNHHQYSIEVLSGKASNDSWFAYVCSLDPCPTHASEGKWQPVDGCADCDDWRDEAVWQKANPGLGTIISKRYLREQVEEAAGMPSKEGIVKRLNFCWWTESKSQWLPPDLWAKGAGQIDKRSLAGQECYGGLDMASKLDVAALVLAFPGDDGVSLLSHFWIPEETADSRQQQDNIPWRVWARQGFVTLTPGNVIDQDRIEADIRALSEDHQIKLINYDPWNAAQAALHLQEHGIEMQEFSQNMRNYNEPSKTFEAWLREGRIKHGDNPVLNWMAGNAVVLTDISGNIRPIKPGHNSPRKVDGVTSAVMAIAGAALAPTEGEPLVECWG